MAARRGTGPGRQDRTGSSGGPVDRDKVKETIEVLEAHQAEQERQPKKDGT